MLEEDERQQLQSIAEDPEMSDIRRRRAETLLLADIGPSGPGLDRAAIAQATNYPKASIGLIIERAMDNGPIEAAMGTSRAGTGIGKKLPRKLSPETEAQITADAAVGDYTQTELSKRFGVSQSTISRIVKRVDHPQK